MWQVAKYQPTTLFSLRPMNATTSGGKTLVTPTPFALKMALLDVAIRVYGLASGKAWFPGLRDLKIAARLSQYLMVNNTFIKILRPHKSGPKDLFGTGLEGPMGNTIAYRELVQFNGPLQLAFQYPDGTNEAPPLENLLAQIHYLGKRGGFMQFQSVETIEELGTDFTLLNPDSEMPFQVNGLLQVLDDCGRAMTFENANVYSGKSISVGRDNGRVAHPVILPYRMVRSSRNFTLYERID